MQVFFEESPERLALLRAGHDIDLQEPEIAVKPDNAKTAAESSSYLGGWFSAVSSHIPYVAAAPPPDPDERFVRMATRVAALHASFQALAAKCSALLLKESVRDSLVVPPCVMSTDHFA